MATLGDVTLHYREHGSGERVLVLLHAFPLHAGMWKPQMAPIADRGWRVLAPDARGFGAAGARSEPAADVLGMETIAGDTAALLDRLGVTKAVIAGLSMGGYAAFELWRRRRDLFRGLVLADTRATPDDEQGRANREAFAKRALENGIGWVAGDMAPKLVTNAPDAVRALILENEPAAVAAAQRGMARRPDSTPTLATIDVPTLVLVGAADALTPPSAARILHEGIRGSTLVEFPGASHLSNLDTPTAFTSALTTWLERV